MCGISDAHSSRCMNQHEEVSNQFIFCAAASARVPAPTRQRSNRGQERNQGERARNFIAMEFLPLKSASVQLWPFQKFLEYFFFSVVYRFSLSLSLSTVDGFSCSHIITVSFAKIRKKRPHRPNEQRKMKRIIGKWEKKDLLIRWDTGEIFLSETHDRESSRRRFLLKTKWSNVSSHARLRRRRRQTSGNKCVTGLKC